MTQEFSRTEKRQAIERELKMRKRVYPRWVEGGKMTQRQADREIAVMETILADYVEPDLFGTTS